MTTETITRDGYTKVISREYEDGSGSTVQDRNAGFQIGTAADPDADYDVTYTYGNKGRFERINDGPGLPGGGVVYDYVTDSDLIETHEFRDTSEDPLVTVTRHYEDHHNLLAWIKNEVNTDPVTTVSKYNYDKVNDAGGYDALGRRRSVVYIGPAFGDGHHNDYGYNNRSELTEADRKTGTTPGSGDPMTPRRL